MRDRSTNLGQMRSVEQMGEFREFLASWERERRTLDAHLPSIPTAQTEQERLEELVEQAGHAVRVGHEPFLAWALAHNPQIARETDPYTIFSRHTLLAQACIGESVSIVRRLIPLSDPNFRDSRGFTPLMMSLRNNQIAITKALIAVSDASLADESGRTALDIAAATGRADAVEALLPVSDAQRIAGSAKLNPLRRAALSDEGDPVQCIHLLLPVSEANQRHPVSGYTALHDVVARAHSLETEKIAALLEACDPLAKNEEGLTPFALAIRLKKWGLAEALAERSDPDEVQRAFEEHGVDKMPRWAARIEAAHAGSERQGSERAKPPGPR